MGFAGFVRGAVCRGRACRAGLYRIGDGFRRAWRAVAAGGPQEGAAPAAKRGGPAAARPALCSSLPAGLSCAPSPGLPSGLPSATPSGRRPRAPLPSGPLPQPPLPAAPHPAPRPGLLPPGPDTAGGGRGRGGFGHAGRGARPRRAAALLPGALLLGLLGLFLLPGGLLLAGEARAAQAISNLARQAGDANPVGVGTNRRRAQCFTTGAKRGGWEAESVRFVIESLSGLSGRTSRLKVALHAPDPESNNAPGDKLFDFTTPGTLGTGQTAFAAPANRKLYASTTYCVVMSLASQQGDPALSLKLYTTDNATPSFSLAGWSLGGYWDRQGSGSWSGPNSYRIRMAINAAIRIPDPPAPGPEAAVGNLAQNTIDQERGAGASKRYQAFTTGGHGDGYALRSVQLEIDRDFTGNVADLSVQIRSDSAGDPGSVLFTLNKPATVAAGTNAFTAPDGAVLAPGATYWVAIGSSGDTLHLSRTESDDEDGGALPGWSIDNRHKNDRSGGLFWSYNNALRLRINAAPVPVPPDAAVGNIAQARDATKLAAGGSSRATRAQGFTTGPAGQGYRLSAIQLDVAGLTGSAGAVSATIRTGFGQNQGRLVADLTVPADLGAGLRTFAAPAGAMLEPDTTYYVTLQTDRTDTTLELHTTTAFAEDGGGLDGWSIGNSSAVGASNTFRPLRLRVRAHPLPAAPPALAGPGGATVSNLAQAPGTGAELAGETWLAQAFRTGPNPAGYDLKWAQIRYDALPAGAAGNTQVRVVPEDSGVPGSSLGFDLVRPNRFGAGTHTYTAGATATPLLAGDRTGVALTGFRPRLRPGDRVTVAYAKPADPEANRLQDAAGNKAGNFTAVPPPAQAPDVALVNGLPAAAPEAPGNLAAAAGPGPGVGKILLTWTEPWANGSPITGYEILITNISAGTSGEFSAITGTIGEGPDGARSYTVTELDEGGRYVFRLRAVNQSVRAGVDTPGPHEATATVTVDGTPPALTVASVGGDGELVLIAFGEDLDRDSLPGPGAFALAVTDGSANGGGAARPARTVDAVAFVHGSDVRARYAAGIDGARKAGIQAALDGIVQRNHGLRNFVYLVPGPALQPGETVTVAYAKPAADAAAGTGPLTDLAGNPAESFDAQAVTNGLAAAAPDAPEGLAAAPKPGDGTAMALTWQTPWHNGSGPIAGYELRTAAGAAPAEEDYGSWTAIAGSGAGTVSHDVTGLTADGALYTFQLRALGSGGEKGAAASVARATPDAGDATLAGLAVTGPAGEAAALAEAFDPATAAYTLAAPLAAGDGAGPVTVTVTATPSQAGAAVAFLDGAGTALADADTAADGFQLALAAGTTALTIRVTATAATNPAAKDYTLRLVRHGACSPDSRDGRFWTGNLLIGALTGTSGGHGYEGGENGGGSLDSTGFRRGVTGYTVTRASAGTDGLTLDLTRPLPAELARDLALYAGDRRYRQASSRSGAALPRRSRCSTSRSDRPKRAAIEDTDRPASASSEKATTWSAGCMALRATFSASEISADSTPSGLTRQGTG